MSVITNYQRTLTTLNLYLTQMQDFSFVLLETYSHELPKECTFARVNSCFCTHESVRFVSTLQSRAAIRMVAHVDVEIN